MKTLCVVQHTESEYLGLMEDHLESRNIRFRYFRPFTAGGKLPEDASEFDGLVLLGAGPFGLVSGPLLPSLAAELRLTRDFLSKGLPVLGIGLGAVILAVAAGGGAEEMPLRFRVGTALRDEPDALAGTLPEKFPIAIYMRDRPVLPDSARILASDESGEPTVFAIGDTALGLLAHPGIKSAMVEDIVMEFEETPDNTAEALERLRGVQAAIAEALSSIMVGLVRQMGWMTPADPSAGGR